MAKSLFPIVSGTRGYVTMHSYDPLITDIKSVKWYITTKFILTVLEYPWKRIAADRKGLTKGFSSRALKSLFPKFQGSGQHDSCLK